MDLKEEIKSRISIVDLVSSYVELKKAGRNYKGLSPFTDEKSASFLVSPEKEIAYCFSTNQGGDIFAFYQLVESVSFVDALKALGQRANLDISKYELSEDKAKKESANVLVSIHEKTQEFFTANINAVGSKRYVDYLISRNFSKTNIAKQGFGVCNSVRGKGLGEFLLKEGFTVDQILESGLCYLNKSKKLFPKFFERLTFPIHNAKGQLVAFAGRTLEANPKLAKYINSPETSIYKKNSILYGFDSAKNYIRKTDYVLLVEGYFDQIACRLNSYENCVAVSGTALTDKQLALLKRFTKNLYFCLDSDAAGLRALYRGVMMAIPLGFNIKVVSLGDYKDPAEVFESDKDLFPRAVDEAKDFFDFYINCNYVSQSNQKRQDPIFLKTFVSEYLDVVRILPDEYIKDFYLRMLAKATSLSYDRLQLSLRNLKTTGHSVRRHNDLDSTAPQKKKVKYTLEDFFWTYFFMTEDPVAATSEFTNMLADILEQKELYKEFILNYNSQDLNNADIPERYRIIGLELESLGLDVDRFDFQTELVQLLTRMKKNYKRMCLRNIRMQLGNCSPKEQLRLLSDYKNLMSL
jgi:DNA primase